VICFAIDHAHATSCGPSPKAASIYLGSTGSLVSPDHAWKFVSIGRKSPDQPAMLYLENLRSSHTWRVGSLKRNGTAFWSDDSRRLFLRDEYAADDTRIRVFDVTRAAPREIRGLDRAIRQAIYARIPKNETTMWLYYPQVCFAASDSSTLMLVADAPVVKKIGDSRGKDFRPELSVGLTSMQVTTSGPRAPQFP
jgi:hypothetical protein